MHTRKYGAEDDPLTYTIIGCAMKVHRKLGPGLKEAAYDDCLFTELSRARLLLARKPKIRIQYDGTVLNRHYCPDFLIEDQVVVEVKSAKCLLPVHDAQVLTYMRLAEIPKGLLINFNVALLVHGIRRLILARAPNGALAK